MNYLRNTLYLLVVATSLFACKKDEGGGCISCSSAQTAAFEVCEDGEGNATVNGENTNTSFETYVNDLQAAGANCGG